MTANDLIQVVTSLDTIFVNARLARRAAGFRAVPPRRVATLEAQICRAIDWHARRHQLPPTYTQEAGRVALAELADVLRTPEIEVYR